MTESFAVMQPAAYRSWATVSARGYFFVAGVLLGALVLRSRCLAVASSSFLSGPLAFFAACLRRGAAAESRRGAAARSRSSAML